MAVFSFTQAPLLLLFLVFVYSTTLLAPVTHAWSMADSVKPKILSVGLSAVDFVATVDHFPEPDEKMRSSQLLVEGGGNAANTACAMAGLLGNGKDEDDDDKMTRVNLLTAVGDDPNGDIILNGLKERGVNVIAERYPGNSPFSYILSHNNDDDGSNTRTCIHQPSSGDMSVDFVKKLDLSEYSAVHFDVRYPTASMALAKRCVKEGIPYSVDVERPREGLKEILEGASVVICNSNYCRSVDDQKDTGSDAECLLRVMSKQAPKAKIAVQTLGSKGSCLVFLDETLRKQAVSQVGKKKKSVTLIQEKDTPTVTLSSDGTLTCGAFVGGSVVDTTGAGDSFIGGFLTALWTQYTVSSEKDNRNTSAYTPESLGRSLRIGSRVAARKIEKPGARSGLPNIDDDEVLQTEFEALLQKQPSMVE